MVLIKEAIHTMGIELLDLLSSIFIMVGVLQCKMKRSALPYIISIMSYIFILTITVLTNNQKHLPPICLILEIIIILICFDENITKNLIFYFTAYIGGYIISAGIILVLSLIYNITASDVWEYDLWRVLVMLTNFLLVLLLSIIIKKKASGYVCWIKNISLKQLAFGLIGILSCVVILGFIQFQGKVSPNGNWSKAADVSIIIVCIFFVIGILILMYIDDSRKRLIDQNYKNEKYIIMQKMHYKEIIENNYEIRSIRHDMKAHLNCILILAKEEKYNELQDYIMKLTSEVEELINKNIRSGNEIFDAIINYMDRENAVNFKVEGNFPNNMKIAPIDLCTIFSNIISNAIEACRKIKDEEDRIIKAIIKRNGNSLYVIIENPTIVRVDISKLITSKSDKKNHGFGVRNIIETVKGYKGEVEFKSTKNKFSVEILFPDIL